MTADHNKIGTSLRTAADRFSFYSTILRKIDEKEGNMMVHLRIGDLKVSDEFDWLDHTAVASKNLRLIYLSFSIQYQEVG